jgi:hypothetical protein
MRLFSQLFSQQGQSIKLTNKVSQESQSRKSVKTVSEESQPIKIPVTPPIDLASHLATRA